jgi:1,4-dihydroxy-6-naphthoate synthase
MPKITIAHSPDTDDVFMFWALATGRIATGERRYELCREDIEVLNRDAATGKYDVSAISFGAYPHLADTYDLLASGASIGEGYGPVIVAREAHAPEWLRDRRIAIPGRLTTAYLVARLALGPFQEIELPFKAVGDAVRRGAADAGILIHEGQLTWRADGLVKVLDLGEWWRAQTGSALALGGNAIRRALGEDLQAAIAGDLRQSIEEALRRRDEALTWTLERCPGLDRPAAERYLDMYVNASTVSMPAAVRAALHELWRRAHAGGLIPRAIEARFIEA